MNSHSHFAGVLRALVFVLAFPILARPALTQGQGDYMNVESPQVSAIALATVGGQKVLLVCNTPDDSVEIWSTAASPQFLYRLPVGLEPVSIHVQANRFWTANFLGDSVTAGQLVLVSASPLDVRARVAATANVGDEPMDIAYDSATNTVFVTLQTSSAVAWLDADTLQPQIAGVPKYDLVTSTGSPPHGLKEPRGIRVRDGRVYLVAFKGGVTHALSTHDLDLLSAPIVHPLVFDRSLGGLGSTNATARFDLHGFLWVVGGEALNFDNETKSEVRTESTGFVQSTLYRIGNPGSTSPTVSRRDTNKEASGAAATKAAALAMPTDLAFYSANGQLKKVFVAAFSSDRIGIIAPAGHTLPVPPNPPTSSIAGWNRRVMNYPAAPVGGNPRWGPRSMVLGANQAGEIRLYVLNRLDSSISIFDPVAETHVFSFALSHLEGVSLISHDPTPAYVRNGRQFLYSADLSGNGFVSCASCHTDGRTDALSWKLGDPGAPPAEPAPAHTFVFGLGDVGIGVTDPMFYLDIFLNIGNPPTLAAAPTFDPDGEDNKREMVTQSLQGLSNFEVPFDPAVASEHAGLVRRLFHNGPFHWRGDKPSVREFNEAFVTLLGGQDLGSPGDSRGLTEPQMDSFERFVHSITLPPNPQQPRNRRFSPDGPSFSGGQQGLEVFHTRPFGGVNGRSCVHCHSLPEGSNNRLTIFLPDPVITGWIGQVNRQPIESAALRGLLQKEPLLEPSGNFPNSTSTTPVLGHFGMNHNGVQPLTFARNPHTSINLFIDVFFPGAQNSPEAFALKQFVHEIDWGVAPMVGRVVQYVEPAGGGLPDSQTLADIREMEDQALEANSGVVVWVGRSSPSAQTRGFFLGAEVSVPILGPKYPYFEEALGSPPTSFGTLGNIENLLAPGDTMIAVSVPLGSERRIASPNGRAQAFPQVAPSSINLLFLRPDTAYEAVPGFRKNWVPLGAPSCAVAGLSIPDDLFDFTGPPDPDTDDAVDNEVDAVFAKTIRLFQYALLGRALPAPHPLGATTYGVSALRHEAPRRIRISGNDIQKGANLLLSVPYPPPGYAGPPPSTPAGQASIPTLTLELPLYATQHAILGGQRVWETAVELEPLWAYALMLGGPRAPGVQQTIDYVISSEYNLIGLSLPPLPNPAPVTEPTTSCVLSPNPFLPDDWDWFKVQVRNPGPGGVDDPTGPVSPATWQQLVMSEP